MLTSLLYITCKLKSPAFPDLKGLCLIQILSLGSCIWVAVSCHVGILKATQRSDRFAVSFFSDQLSEKHK